MSFNQFQLDSRLLTNVQAMGFEQPTPIQIATIPAALKGQDILGSAETGTGKTAAYLLPLLQRFLAAPDRARQPRALILVPTRELALQVFDQAQSLGRHTGVRAVTIYGGVGYGDPEQGRQRGGRLV